MMKSFACCAAASLGVAMSFASQPGGEDTPLEAIPVAKSTEDGLTLVVPADHEAKGRVYYAITNKDRQIYFESNAPLENIKGQSNRVIGYSVLSPDVAGTLVAGEWHLPVSSMKTGIELRDEHLAGDGWLDSAKFPDVIVQVREFQDVRQTRQSAAFTTYAGTLVADLTLHGVTSTIEIPETTVTLMPESAATRKVARGDLMAIRSTFRVTLADHGVSHPVIGEKVAKEVEINVSLYLSTRPPQPE